VVVEAGGPVLMPWIDRVPAVLQAWYPGQRGGEAIANILFGDVDPSGRLPITFPARADQAPRKEPAGLAELHAAEARREAGDKSVYGMSGGIAPFAVDYPEGADVGYRWYAARQEKPLFPFGYGLSYTSFRYANLRIEGGARLTVTFDVANSGKRPGADVPQLYVEAKSAAGTSAYRLAGFEKVWLKPGETRRVSLTVDPRVIGRFDEDKPGWRLDAGVYKLRVGHFAGDAALSGTASLDALALRP
jgi:beta-glucosidase